jgi:hypothetical protein
MGPERDIYEKIQRTKQSERQPKIVVDSIKLNTWMIELDRVRVSYKKKKLKTAQLKWC